MQLGGLPKIGATQEKQVSEKDFDFSALERKVDSMQRMQMYMLIALAVIVILNINGKN